MKAVLRYLRIAWSVGCANRGSLRARMAHPDSSPFRAPSHSHLEEAKSVPACNLALPLSQPEASRRKSPSKRPVAGQLKTMLRAPIQRKESAAGSRERHDQQYIQNWEAKRQYLPRQAAAILD